MKILKNEATMKMRLMDGEEIKLVSEYGQAKGALRYVDSEFSGLYILTVGGLDVVMSSFEAIKKKLDEYKFKEVK